MLVKTVGVRKRTDKMGKTVKYTGNVYLHYLSTCLKRVRPKFYFCSNYSSSIDTLLPPGGQQAIVYRERTTCSTIIRI